ncbi:MAG: YciI family protein [Anaerolineae bacterium]|nr:YciI family protein [Anaerolineae bacterium]
MAEQQHFVCIIRPTRAGFVDDPTPEEERIMSDHFQYLKNALEAGTMLMAGPCIAGADTFGLIVLRVDSKAAAQAFIDGDPSVANGVQQATLYPFRLSLWAGK